MTTQAKGTLLQRTRRVLSRAFELWSIQETKLFNAAKRKSSWVYPLARVVALIIKLALIVFLIFIATWLIAALFLIFAFLGSKSSPTKEDDVIYGTDRYETKYPGQ